MADLDFKVKNGLYLTGATIDSAATTFTLFTTPTTINVGSSTANTNFVNKASINGYDIQIMEIMGAWA